MANFKEFSLHTEKTGVYNITQRVNEFIAECNIESGIAIVYCPHTTAALTINENTDDNVGTDILMGLENAFPDLESFKHSEGNSYAHMRSSAIGCELVLIIEDGWPMLGIWQNIYFLEFDGPRERKFYVKVIKD